jgi:hypothetical protein
MKFFKNHRGVQAGLLIMARQAKGLTGQQKSYAQAFRKSLVTTMTQISPLLFRNSF